MAKKTQNKNQGWKKGKKVGHLSFELKDPVDLVKARGLSLLLHPGRLDPHIQQRFGHLGRNRTVFNAMENIKEHPPAPNTQDSQINGISSEMRGREARRRFIHTTTLFHRINPTFANVNTHSHADIPAHTPRDNQDHSQKK